MWFLALRVNAKSILVVIVKVNFVYSFGGGGLVMNLLEECIFPSIMNRNMIFPKEKKIINLKSRFYPCDDQNKLWIRIETQFIFIIIVLKIMLMNVYFVNKD